MKPIVWWIIGAIVLLLIMWLIARAMSGRRTQAHREEAAAIRTQAEQHDRELNDRQAQADEAAAQSRQAQAEADAANARARQLQAETDRRQEAAAEVRNTRDEHLRRADALDPDVRTDKEGYRLDESGNRIDDAQDSRLDGAAAGAAGAGAAGAYAAHDRHDGDAADRRLGGEEYEDAQGNARGDRDHDGHVGLDDRVENKVDSAIGHDDPTRNNVGDGVDDNRTNDVAYDDSRREGYADDTARRDGIADDGALRDDRYDGSDLNRTDERYADRETLGERVHDKLDDVSGRRDADGDGRRG